MTDILDSYNRDFQRNTAMLEKMIEGGVGGAAYDEKRAQGFYNDS